MTELFTLGEHYVSDFIKDKTSAKKYELKLVYDEKIGAARLEKSAPLDTMYGKYWYRSGINTTMKKELESIVNSITSLVSLRDRDLWTDIASNDGSLLSYVPKNLTRVGIDPADDSFRVEAEKHADIIVQDYFSKKSYPFENLKSKVITCIAMFYDLEDPVSFLKDVYEVLDDNGLFVLQLSYTPLMVRQLAFDNICFTENMFISGINKKIKDVSTGDKIIDQKGNIDVVKKVFKRKYEGKVFNIKPMYIDEIECTPEHPILVVKKNNIKTLEKEWVKAEEISKNDYVVIPKIKTITVDKNINLEEYNDTKSPNYRRGMLEISLTDDILWMMGLYVAEGYISGPENNLIINFSLNKKEKEYISRLYKIFNNLNYKVREYPSKISGGINIQTSCTSLARCFRKWFGEGALNKSIPDFIFYSDKEIFLPFIKGLINGDGYINNYVNFHSSSKKLVYQLQLMLAKIDIMTTFSYVRPYERFIRNKKVISKDSWTLRGRNKNVSKIFNIENINNNNVCNYKYDEDYIYVPVRKIQVKEINDFVYNFETLSNTYTVNNIVVHNCHEHTYYHSLLSMKKLFDLTGFKIMDCQLNDVNGGSFRLYVMKDLKNNDEMFSTQPYRDVCKMRVDSLSYYEERSDLNLHPKKTWSDFHARIDLLKSQVVDFIVKEKTNGKKIWAYGASTKGNTLLQYFGLDNTLIDGIAERSPYKYGLKTIGTNIPIYSEEEMRKVKPDYLLILPWHFFSEFTKREKEYLDNGGKFIVPCPKFKIV